MQNQLANPVPDRWLAADASSYDLDAHLRQVQKKMRHFALNVYLLNSRALRIQHWFFKMRHRRCQRQNLVTPTSHRQQVCHASLPRQISSVSPNRRRTLNFSHIALYDSAKLLKLLSASHYVCANLIFVSVPIKTHD